MNTHLPEMYMPPKTGVYLVVTDRLCIGFGEGSIPPEDSDANPGWFEEELTEEPPIPTLHARLWDE